MQLAVEEYQGSTRRDLVVEMKGYVKEFTRHSNDVLLNLNELRHRNILTDATLLVGSARLHAHCAVLIACRSVLQASPGHMGQLYSLILLPIFLLFPVIFPLLILFSAKQLIV